MSDPYENLDPWEGYERLCKDKAELEAENKRLQSELEDLKKDIGRHVVHISGAERMIARLTTWTPCSEAMPPDGQAMLIRDADGILWIGGEEDDVFQGDQWHPLPGTALWESIMEGKADD